jgi:hypothetical protein
MTIPESQANQATISDLKTPNRQEYEGAPVSVTLFKEALLRDDPDRFDLRLEVRDSGMFFHLRQSHASYSRLSSLTGRTITKDSPAAEILAAVTETNSQYIGSSKNREDGIYGLAHNLTINGTVLEGTVADEAAHEQSNGAVARGVVDVIMYHPVNMFMNDDKDSRETLLVPAYFVWSDTINDDGSFEVSLYIGDPDQPNHHLKVIDSLPVKAEAAEGAVTPEDPKEKAFAIGRAFYASVFYGALVEHAARFSAPLFGGKGVHHDSDLGLFFWPVTADPFAE